MASLVIIIMTNPQPYNKRKPLTRRMTLLLDGIDLQGEMSLIPNPFLRLGL